MRGTVRNAICNAAAVSYRCNNQSIRIIASCARGSGGLQVIAPGLESFVESLVECFVENFPDEKWTTDKF